MQTRHSNLVAMAHFLKTRTEPALVCESSRRSCDSIADGGMIQYYKPWQLRPGDDAVIREQVKDAEATVAREVADFDSRYPPEAFVREDLKPASTEEQPKQQDTSEQQPESRSDHPSAPEPQPESREPQETTDMVGAQTNTEQREPVRTDTPANGADEAAHQQSDAHHDDGGEVVEDKEDTVIY